MGRGVYCTHRPPLVIFLLYHLHVVDSDVAFVARNRHGWYAVGGWFHPSGQRKSVVHWAHEHDDIYPFKIDIEIDHYLIPCIHLSELKKNDMKRFISIQYAGKYVR